MAPLTRQVIAVPHSRRQNGVRRHDSHSRLALPFLPMTLRKGGLELNLFTTITPLGTPHDVTVRELRLESFFPADAASRAWFAAHAQ